MKNPIITACAACVILFPTGVHAAVSYVTAGSTYSEDFDRTDFAATDETTKAWANDTTVPGWYWINNSGTTPTTFRASDTNSATQGELLSLGSAGATDRAIGHQSASSTDTIRYGVQILNSTGAGLGSFSVSYKGEQWRRIQNETSETLVFDFQIFNVGTTNPLAATTGWTALTSLDFATPTHSSATSSGLDGNAAANSATLTGVANGLSWAAGRELWLRWSDSGAVANRRSAIGVDDVVFSATVPEPTTALLGAFGILGLLIRRR